MNLFLQVTVEKYSANATGYLHRISELHRHRLIRKPKKSSGVTSLRDFALNRMMVVSDTVKMKGK